jgi:pimeloyl-ACP methyl ester carboxylesterase
LTAALALLALGCSYGISVRRAGQPDLLNAWRASLIEANELSPRTQQTLHQLDLSDDYRRTPLEAITKLQGIAITDPQPAYLFALSEMCYVQGQRAEKSRTAEACAFFYFSAGYAYHFIFQNYPFAASRLAPESATTCPTSAKVPPLAAEGDSQLIFDPRFRLACDLYNNSLAKCIRAAQQSGWLDPRQELRLSTPDGEAFTLSVVHHGFLWQPEEFGPFLFAGDYQVVGLANHYRTFGLGVPLIGTRAETAPAGPGRAFYPREVSFPVTAFFRFEGGLAELSARRAGRLELYNPLHVRSVEVCGRTIPLETDLTTPLAYFLSRTDLQGIEYTGFLRVEQAQDRSGIYMFEPYQPGKIPVVMVHGLLGSPLTWTPMFNDLRADPELRERYQFWFYLYPTGNPYLVAAADLRKALKRLRDDLDPDNRDPALDQMVLVGHSMGGLVSKLLTVDSGEDFWKLVSRQPLDQLDLQPATRELLRRMYFFQRRPYVKRVVFIATPHHGSSLSPSTVGRVAARFIQLPQKLMAAAQDVAAKDPKALGAEGVLPTSVDLLAPGAPVLELLARRPKPADVRYHSIIGVSEGSGDKGSDGVVPVTSARLEGVDSELVVPASHNQVHHHPRAVQEVRRILQEHWQTLQGLKGPPIAAQPASWQPTRARAVAP